MKKSAILAGVALALAAIPLHSNATDFGYCTDDAGRDNIFRVGATTKQGLAIRLDNSKLELLKGSTISSIKAAFGSRRTTDGNVDLFIATSLDGEPLVSQTVAVSSTTKWIEFTLDKPYTITGNEEALYVGYTGEISVQSTLLMADFTADAAGCCYAWSDGKWIDTYGLGYGCASIRIGVDNAPSFCDLMIKPLVTEGYYKVGDGCTLNGQIFNFGTGSVDSFDLEINLGESRSVSHVTTNLKQGQVYDFTLPDNVGLADGDLPVSIEVSALNGGNDADTSDNVFESSIYYYPADMERAVLLEGFTGQDCSNCPSGHSTLNAFLEGVTGSKVIEVMHHAGYSPDFFTMDSDLDYTYFYGGSGTFAPAVMMNRTICPAASNVPVMKVSQGNLTAAYNQIENTHPYVSLAIESKYDPATRALNVKLSSYAHTDLPEGLAVLNVMLVQDGLSSYQLPYGAGYAHDAVFRGVLTGNSWGLLLTDEQTLAGGKAEWSTSLTLPEAIFSDAYNPASLTADQIQAYTWPVVAENMRLVAYVGGYGQTTADHTVYNAVEAHLGDSYTQGGFSGVKGVEVDAAKGLAIRVVDGRIVVDGKCDSLAAYTLQGRAVDVNATLTPGLYIVRATAGNNVTVSKILVR